MKKQDAKNKIQHINDNTGLLSLWNDILFKTTKNSGWDAGFAFEYMILRAFELEGAETKYPYSVYMDGIEIEQIDGFVYLKEFNLPVIIESKDKGDPQNIEPIAKLRNQLMRRPAGAIGSIFSTSGFTGPAGILGQFLAPNTILFWEKEEIEYCLTKKYFIQGTMLKYKHAIENGIYNFVIS